MTDDRGAPAEAPVEAPAPAPEPARLPDRPEPVRWLRPGRVALFVAAALALYYLANLFAVFRAGRADEAAPVEAIVVLGAAQYDGRPSPQLAARLDHVVTLWDRGLAPRVVVTGGKQPGDRFTEAEASRNYLVARGVPEAAILSEDTSHNTYDSLAAVADVLEALADQPGEGEWSVLLVTDPFHAARAEMIADEVGLAPRSSPTPTSVVGGSRSFGLHLKEAAGISVGRVIGFERLTSLTG